jgi:flagella synthesis protein FlgN
MSAPPVDTLLQCVARQSAVVTDFIQLLEEEARTLLDSISNEQLVALTERKNAFATQLMQLDHDREECLETLRFTADEAGIEAACAAHPALRAPFDGLFALARQARSLNAQNGQIIAAFLASNERAFNTLRNLMGENLYDAKGRLTATRPTTP